MYQGEYRTGSGDAEDRGEIVQGALDSSVHPPLLSTPRPLPCLSQAYRARLQADRPVRCDKRPAGGVRSRAEDTEELSGSQAVQLLLHTEAQLLERRDRRRLANTMQLQEMIGSLDELVLLPP